MDKKIILAAVAAVAMLAGAVWMLVSSLSSDTDDPAPEPTDITVGGIEQTPTPDPTEDATANTDPNNPFPDAPVDNQLEERWYVDSATGRHVLDSEHIQIWLPDGLDKDTFDQMYREASSSIESAILPLLCGQGDYTDWVTQEFAEKKFGDYESRFDPGGVDCPRLNNVVHTVFDVDDQMMILQTEYDIDYTGNEEGFKSSGFQDTHATVTYKVVLTDDGWKIDDEGNIAHNPDIIRGWQ